MATLKRRGGSASFHTAKKYFINKGRKFATVLDTPTFMGTRIQAKNLIDISERCRSFAQLSKSIPKTCIQKKDCKKQIDYLSADVESIKDFVNSYPNKKDWEDIKTTDDMSKDEAVFLFRLELLSKRLQDYAHPPPTDTPTVYKDVYYVSELYKRTHPEYDSTGIPPDIKDVVAKEMNPGLETTLKKDENAASEKDNNLQELAKKFYDIEREDYPEFLKQLQPLKNQMDSAFWFNKAVKEKNIGDKIITNKETLHKTDILGAHTTFEETPEEYAETTLKAAQKESKDDYDSKKKAYDEKNKEDPRRAVINEEIKKVKESLKNAEIKFMTDASRKSKTEVVDLKKYLSEISAINPSSYKTILKNNMTHLKNPKYGGTAQAGPGTAQSGPGDSTYKPSPMIQAYGPKIFELWKIELKEIERTFYQEYRAQFINGPLKALEAYDKSNDIAESDLNKLITKNGPAESGTGTGTGSNSNSSSGSGSNSSSGSSSSSFTEEESKEHLEKLKSSDEIIVTSKKNSSIKFILRKKNTGTKKIYEIEVAAAPGSNTVIQTGNRNMTLRNRGNVKVVKPPGNNPEGGVVVKPGTNPEGGPKPGTNPEGGPKPGTNPEGGPNPGTNPQGPNAGNNLEAITTATAKVEELKNAIGILMDNIEASDKTAIEPQLPIVANALASTDSSKTALNKFPQSEDAKKIITEIERLSTLATETTKEANNLITELGPTPDDAKIQEAKAKYSVLIKDTLRARLNPNPNPNP